MAGQGEQADRHPQKTGIWMSGQASVHFQFNNSKSDQGLLTYFFFFHTITYLSHLGERNPFVEWTENEVKPALDFRVLKTTNIKTPNCCSFMNKNAHSIHIWTQNCGIFSPKKLNYWLKICWRILPLFLGWAGVTSPCSSLWGKGVRSYCRPSLKRDMSGLAEKVLLVSSLGKSNSRAVYFTTQEGDYQWSAKPWKPNNGG